jgi:hypothetical protein
MVSGELWWGWCGSSCDGDDFDGGDGSGSDCGGRFWDLYACADAYVGVCIGVGTGSWVPVFQRILLIAECELHKEITGREDFITGILCLSVVSESHVGHFSMLV